MSMGSGCSYTQDWSDWSAKTGGTPLASFNWDNDCNEKVAVQSLTVSREKRELLSASECRLMTGIMKKKTYRQILIIRI